MEENIKQAMRCTMEDFLQKIKGEPMFQVYKQAVLSSETDTDKLLQATVGLLSLTDRELGMMSAHLSSDLLFSIVDQRLRNEIMEKECTNGKTD